MQAVLDPIQTEPASFPLDLPSSILYPDFEFSLPEPGSADSLPAFQVDTLSKANWCVSRVLEAEDRIARRAELAAELHSRIDNWLAKASTADNDSISYLSMLLRPFVDAELSIQRRSRSLLLPSGTASLRKLPDRLDIVDREAALAYCKANHPGGRHHQRRPRQVRPQVPDLLSGRSNPRHLRRAWLHRALHQARIGVPHEEPQQHSPRGRPHRRPRLHPWYRPGHLTAAPSPSTAALRPAIPILAYSRLALRCSELMHQGIPPVRSSAASSVTSSPRGLLALSASPSSPSMWK